MGNPLRTLLDLPDKEKRERGLIHTPREIGQQPRSWKTTYQYCLSHTNEIRAALTRAGLFRGSNSRTVYLVGAGTSDFAGRALIPVLRAQWGGDVWAVPSTTLLTDFEGFHTPGRQYFWISCSRSGDSPEGVALLERALKKHAEIHHLVITCNQQGQMAQLCSRHPDRATALVLDDAVNDRGLAMTSSFTNTVVAGQSVGRLESLAQYGETLAAMAEAGENFLSAAAEVAGAIATLGCVRACFVGSGALLAVAHESALKVLELTGGKVATMAQSPLGLRHGPISSVDGQTVFVAFLSSDSRRRGYELDLLDEISRKHLARVRVVVTAGAIEDLSSRADYILSLNCPPDFPDEYRPPLDVILGQLLGLFSSLNVGLKPDQPSPNGAISRVVSPIRIYT